MPGVKDVVASPRPRSALFRQRAVVGAARAMVTGFFMVFRSRILLSISFMLMV